MIHIAIWDCSLETMEEACVYSLDTFLNHENSILTYHMAKEGEHLHDTTCNTMGKEKRQKAKKTQQL